MDGVKENTWKLWTQRRYMLTLFIFLGYFNIYSLRVNMSVAIVAMTKSNAKTLENGTEINIDPEFDWDNKIQGYVLSSFFYGYITTQLVGGLLSKKIGGKLVFGGGIASTALITLVCPWLAEFSVYALIVARILMGVFEGVTFSSLYTLWAKWTPPLERSRTTTQAFSGNHTGAVFAMMFYGYLSEVAGWRSIFWFSGGMGVIWFAAWTFYIAESPETDPRITEQELRYIQASVEVSKTQQELRVKWKSLLTSKAAWSLNAALFGEMWGFYTLLTLLPKYFRDIFQYHLSKTGILSSLPYIALALMMHVTGQIADKLIIKKWMTITHIRKLFIAIGFVAQASFMMGVAFWGSPAGTVFCLVMAVGLGSFALSTISVNALDIAPRHASMAFGVANTWGTVPGIISPIIAGHIISTDSPTVEQWRVVFYITASLYLCASIFYGIFASGTRQQWDIDEEKESRLDKENILGLKE